MSFPSQYYYFYSRCDSNGKNYHNLPNIFGETYGENSLCILSSLAPSGYISDPMARCHKITCNYDESKFNIDIGDVEVECSGKYEEVTVDGYSGSLICPDFDRVCSGSVWCNDPLICIEKQSLYDEYEKQIDEDYLNKNENYLKINCGKKYNVSFYVLTSIIICLLL